MIYRVSKRHTGKGGKLNTSQAEPVAPSSRAVQSEEIKRDPEMDKSAVWAGSGCMAVFPISGSRLISPPGTMDSLLILIWIFQYNVLLQTVHTGLYPRNTPQYDSTNWHCNGFRDFFRKLVFYRCSKNMGL